MGDKKLSKQILKWTIVLGIAVSFSVLIMTLYYNNAKVFQVFESASLNWRFSIRTLLTGYATQDKAKMETLRTGAYKQIVINGIDDRSIDAYGGSFPFDRQVWADMLNSINARPLPLMPSLMFFDIVFADRSQNPAGDQAMINAFSNYKGLVGEDIILDLIKEQDMSEIISSLGANQEAIIEAQNALYKKYCWSVTNERIQALSRFQLPLKRTKNIRTYPIVTTLLPDIVKSMDFVGTANIYADQTTFRIKPLVVGALYFDGNGNLTNVYYPSIVLAMVTKLLKSDITNILVEKNLITIRNATYQGQTGDFKIPVDDFYQLEINYRSTPESGFINVIPMKDFTKKPLPKDAIVFTGMYSKKGTYDIWYSPMGDMFGVEHLAYAVGTILNRDFIRPVPEWVNILLVLMIALLSGIMVASGTKFTPLAAVISIIVPLLVGVICMLFNVRIITFIPVLTSVLVLITIQIYMLLTEGKEKKFIKATFSSYVNPKLVDILIQNPDALQLGGADRNVTVFFSGLKGLEHIAEKVSPKELIEYLNQYFSKMADLVMETNGTLDKYIGDAVMAFWNAPVDLKNHALKACQASVKMLAALDQFNDEMKVKGYPAIHMNIGINTGNLVVGNVGSEQQKNYTAIGDSVNLASRLKGLNKFFHTNIVISEFTYEQVKDWVIARELDLTKVKGKNKPVRIYELLDVIKWDD